MAIVVYKCDVCKREKEYVQNVEGIEKIQRCTITHGCRGKLFQTKTLPDYIRASTTERVLGLDEWRQRKVLYNHIQTIARDNWIINHSLGTSPAVSVFVNIPTEANPDNLVEIIPIDIDVVDENNMILKFDRPWSGIAQLVARQSDPNLLKPLTRSLSSSTQNLQQISLKGVIVIATRVSSTSVCDDIELGVSYQTTQNTTIDKSYIVSKSNQSPNSTWNDFNRVVIKGQLYDIRSYEGIYEDMINETISFGSTFSFTTISANAPCTDNFNARAIEFDEVYILFANAPYETVDKVITQYIDVADLNIVQNPIALLYDNSEFFAKKSAIQSTYPPIRDVL